MTINGVDVTQQFFIICGSIFLLLYIALIYFVIRSKPKTKKKRSLKAALLIAGLPVLGMPLLFGIISLVFLFQSSTSAMETSKLFQMLFLSLITPSACLFPFSVIMSAVATWGTYYRLQSSDAWLDTIVPP